MALGQIVPGTGFKIRSLGEYAGYITCQSKEIHSSDFDSLQNLPTIHLTSSDITRWKMAWRATKLDKDKDYFSYRVIEWRIGNWPDTYRMNELGVVLGFSLAALIYGGLHALAWSANFESFIERLLWRVSACIVMGGAPIAFILWKLGDLEVFDSYQFLLGRLPPFILGCLGCLVLLVCWHVATSSSNVSSTSHICRPGSTTFQAGPLIFLTSHKRLSDTKQSTPFCGSQLGTGPHTKLTRAE